MVHVSSGVFSELTWPKVSKFVQYTSQLKEYAKFEMRVDKKFSDKVHKLRRKMYTKKITPQKFWDEYKKLILNTEKTHGKWLRGIVKKTDAEMKKAFKKAEKEAGDEDVPPLDLSVPE